MKYTSKAAEKSTVKFTIKFDAEEWKAAQQNAYLKTRARFAINGFRNGTGIVAIPATDTIAQTDGNGNILSSSRKNLYSVQTPQGFNVGLLKKAYSMMKR